MNPELLGQVAWALWWDLSTWEPQVTEIVGRTYHEGNEMIFPERSFKGIMLSEIRQTEKNKYRMISLIRGIVKKQTHRNREQIGRCQRRWGEDGLKGSNFQL